MKTSHLKVVVCALLIAVVVGLLYSLSPLSAWCFAWMALLFRWTASGTRGRERRWLLAILGAALALRIVAIGILPFIVDSSRHAYTTYFGDAQYAIQRSIWIRNIFLGIPVAARDYIEAFEPVFGYSGFNYVLAFLHVLFGPSPYGVAFFSTGLFLTASAMLYRLCRETFGPLAAIGGLALLLFDPTWVAWSVAPLKETAQFFLLASMTVAVIAIAAGRWPAKLCGLIALAIALDTSDTVRSGGLAIAALGLGLGVALWLSTRRWWTAVATILLVSLGVAWGARNPAIRAAVVDNVQTAALRHFGHTRSSGEFYRALDEKFYAHVSPNAEDGESFALTFDEGLRFLIRSVVAFFAQPLPSSVDSAKWLLMVPLQVVWWGASLLALVGAIRGLWRHPLLASLFVGFIVASVVAIAPNSGNLGTLIRHRDVIMPFVAMLAGLGGVTLAERFVALSDPVLASRDHAVESWP